MTLTSTIISYLVLFLSLLFAYFYISSNQSATATGGANDMSSKSNQAQMIAELRAITGATSADALKLAKNHKTIEGAIGGFYGDAGMQSRAKIGANGGGGGASSGGSSSKAQEKKLGEIFDKYMDPDTAGGKWPMITIEGTLRLCEDLDIDPESDVVMFCLAADLGSKATGEFERGPFIAGWQAMPGNIDSTAGMKKALPTLRTNIYADPAYFKKVYMHSFEMAKPAGSRTLGLEDALALWPLFIKPALSSSPSALSHISPGTSPLTPSELPPQFTEEHLDKWLEFMTKKGKAVSKDTWSLLFDFMRSIDPAFEEYDENAAWPSTIDDYVEFVRSSK